ncbi:universal stress protein [Haloglomus halophilum]|uniref:universal stress protein n=1 Tax=Haloglomus halophilum TaxID=2962672 RepID=UPI0020C9423F|nr:universal stress protein [Haloglomus halophilum]
MTVMVAYDGSDLSRAALRRGVELGDALGQQVVAVSVVPDDSLYAREQGWVSRETEYVPSEWAERFATEVEQLAPDAEFRLETLDDAHPRDIAKQLRRAAYDLDAEVVVLGSDNAGRIVSPVSSVGDTVVSSPIYDVYIVRSVD